MDIGEFFSKNGIDSITKEIIVSERLKDILFKIKALSIDEFYGVRERAVLGGGRDINKFKTGIIIRGCVEPDFKNSRDIELVGARTPEEYVKKVLAAGEISYLAGEILRLSGFGERV